MSLEIEVSVPAPPTITVTAGLGGSPGPAGKSAYQSALDSGFDGSEEEWLASLQGEDGAPGEPGEDGAPGEPGAPGEVDPAELEQAIEDYLTANPPGGAVDSVAGKTGAVTLTADDMTDGTTNHVFTAADDTKLTGIASGATANSTDATLLARANHTGTQSADTLTDGTTNKAFLATERTKLAGIATAATANDTDANLKARANHTGTQLASTISDFSTAADARVAAGITGKADLASPALTGNPTAPTASPGDNDTTIATTAFVTAAVAAGGGGAAPEVESDTTSTYSYMGTAASGTATSSSGWAVTRITVNVSPPVIKHGTGTWTGRAGLTYS